jgi:methyl-accepting chemotaxis protein
MHRLIAFQLPIAAKTMLLIGALAIMSAAANWFCLRSLHEIDEINSIVTQKVEPVRLTLTEAKIAVESLGLATKRWPAQMIRTLFGRPPMSGPVERTKRSSSVAE